VLTWLAKVAEIILPAGGLAGYQLPTCLPNSWDPWSWSKPGVAFL
jgi:hypothetical protein